MKAPSLKSPHRVFSVSSMKLSSRGVSRIAAVVIILSVASEDPLVAQPLEIAPAGIDFGERGHGESAETKLAVRNPGKESVRVTFRPSCSCMTISPKSAVFAPGAVRSVKLTMSSGRGMGLFSKYIEVKSAPANGGAETKRQIPVRMRVFVGYRMDPREMRFAAVLNGEPVSASIDVRPPKGRKAADLRLEYVGVKGRGREVSSTAFSKLFSAAIVPTGTGKRLTLTLKPGHPEGRVWVNYTLGSTESSSTCRSRGTCSKGSYSCPSSSISIASKLGRPRRTSRK